MFSIIIPTWNNLEFLKLCVASIRLHSKYDHQIVLHINDGSDGTQNWADTEGVVYTRSDDNIGICEAVNWAFGKTEKNYIVYLNDDMYVLPNWDVALVEEIEKIGNQPFMLSATMIEPRHSADSYIIHADYGTDLTTFQEGKLLAEFAQFDIPDWTGSSWPPLVISREAWLKVGGFSIEFSPGMYSDPDLSMKLWRIGCRIFKGIGRSRVYHFQARSTGRIVRNDGRRQFMEKWGITASDFYKNYLHMGAPYAGALLEPPPSVARRMRLKTRLKLLAKFL
jgi:GT2 family glycosyltransferase